MKINKYLLHRKTVMSLRLEVTKMNAQQQDVPDFFLYKKDSEGSKTEPCRTPYYVLLS